MIKLFGKKETFAIEIQECGKEDVYFFCFWCNNKQIGDFSMPIYIKDSIWWLRDFLIYKECRHIQNSHDIVKERLFCSLYGYMISSNECVEYLEHASECCKLQTGVIRMIFHMDSIGCEAFIDTVGIILINEKKHQRIIWKNFIDGTLHECFIPLGCFDKVAIEFLNFFDVND